MHHSSPKKDDIDTPLQPPNTLGQSIQWWHEAHAARRHVFWWWQGRPNDLISSRLVATSFGLTKPQVTHESSPANNTCPLGLPKKTAGVSLVQENLPYVLIHTFDGPNVSTQPGSLWSKKGAGEDISIPLPIPCHLSGFFMVRFLADPFFIRSKLLVYADIKVVHGFLLYFSSNSIIGQLVFSRKTLPPAVNEKCQVYDGVSVPW